MEQLVRGFEQQLKQRLSQKTTSHISEESQLLRTFKYFDLDNSGEVTINELRKVLEKLGVWLASEDDLKNLFKFYDKNKNNSIDYQEFVQMIFQPKNQSNKKKNDSNNEQEEQKVGDFSISKITNKETEQLVEKMRGQFYGRGGKTILGLGRQFKILDDSGNRRLDFNEFNKGLRDFGVKMSIDEQKQLFQHFDRNQDGSLDYDEFLVVIRGPMNNFRQKFVDQAFRKLDKTGDGKIEIDDIIDVYSVAKHPDYINGKKTKEQILREFMHTFEQYSDIRGIDDGIITQEEFRDYYNFISASIDNDQYFELMMNNCWRINSSDNDTWNKKGWSNQQDNNNNNNNNNTLQTAYQKNVALGKSQLAPFGTDDQKKPELSQKNQAKNYNQNIDLLMSALRKKVSSRGANGIFSLGRLFRNIDDNNSKSLSLEEFTKCMNEFRLGFDESDISKVFKYFDRDGSGELSYDEFLRGVRGEMNQSRVKVVRMAFNKLDADKSGIVDINDIKQFYNAKMHPDVKAGKKSEDEVLGEFLDTFEQHHSQKDGNSRDGQVNFDEFSEYYNNISSSIDNDEYFDLMIKSAWKLQEYDRTYAKGYKNQI